MVVASKLSGSVSASRLDNLPMCAWASKMPKKPSTNKKTDEKEKLSLASMQKTVNLLWHFPEFRHDTEAWLVNEIKKKHESDRALQSAGELFEKVPEKVGDLDHEWMGGFLMHCTKLKAEHIAVLGTRKPLGILAAFCHVTNCHPSAKLPAECQSQALTFALFKDRVAATGNRWKDVNPDEIVNLITKTVDWMKASYSLGGIEDDHATLLIHVPTKHEARLKQPVGAEFYFEDAWSDFSCILKDDDGTAWTCANFFKKPAPDGSLRGPYKGLTEMRGKCDFRAHLTVAEAQLKVLSDTKKGFQVDDDKVSHELAKNQETSRTEMKEKCRVALKRRLETQEKARRVSIKGAFIRSSG